MKYLVMECFTSYAVLLDEEGRFVKAANLRYQEGQTVENPVLMKEGEAPAKKIYKFTRFAAVAASLLLLLTIYSQNYLISYASIYMTINPSICMELNRKGQVIKVSGVNEDGVKLLESYEQTSKDRLVVTDELIARAIDMGFLSEGGQVTIDIDAPDEAHFQEYGKELRENLDQYLQEKMTVEIQIQSYSAEELNRRLEERDGNSDYDVSDYEAKEETVPKHESTTPQPTPQPTPQSTPQPKPQAEQEPQTQTTYGVTDYGTPYEEATNYGDTGYSESDSSSDYDADNDSGYDSGSNYEDGDSHYDSDEDDDDDDD